MRVLRFLDFHPRVQYNPWFINKRIEREDTICPFSFELFLMASMSEVQDSFLTTLIQCILDQQLVTNQIIQAVTQTRQMKVEKWSNGIKRGLCTSAVQVAEHSLSASSEEETDLTLDDLGHFSWLSFNHSGPFHQSVS